MLLRLSWHENVNQIDVTDSAFLPGALLEVFLLIFPIFFLFAQVIMHISLSA